MENFFDVENNNFDDVRYFSSMMKHEYLYISRSGCLALLEKTVRGCTRTAITKKRLAKYTRFS